MMVQSPLKRQQTKPNLRKVPKPEVPKPAPKANTVYANKRNNETSASKRTSFPTIKPGKVILATVLIGVFGFIYLTHVFATQKLLQEVQSMEIEYNKARQMHDELKLKYDRMVGPAEIYQKAKQQGFVNGGPADKVIVLKE